MKQAMLGLLTLILVAAGCAHTPSPPPSPAKPDWVQGSSARYSSRLYLTGVGVGTNRRQAEDAARSEIAKVFKVRILASTLDWMKSETLPGQKEAFAQQVEALTTTSVDQVLEGTAIAELWEDRERGTVYALAVLDRERTAGILRERIRQLDGEVAAIMAIPPGNAPLAGLREAVRAADAIQKRDLLNAELAVASSEGAGIPAPYSYGEAAAIINRILAKVRLGVSISGDDSGAVRLAAIDGIARAGFQVPTDPAQTDIQVKGSVSIRSVEVSHSPWRWYTAQFLGELVDAKGGLTLGILREESREGAQEEGTARERTLRELSTRVADGIKRELIRSVGGGQ